MKFRSEIKCIPGPKPIDHGSKIVLLGSCFSENIARKFEFFRFQYLINPFGILFNPVAISNAINRCAEGKLYEEKELFQYRNTWMSLDHHSSFDHKNKEEALRHINSQLQEGNASLREASHVIITLGTSWVYRWKKDHRVAGNCHKLPQDFFDKELLSSDEIGSSLVQMIRKVKSVNQKVHFIFTVSPVRHLKDGFVENTLSKSLLHAAIHRLGSEKYTSYFPSYEIMMDDLRDYRFYGDDLVHPNDMAVDYIWQHFEKSWISEQSRELMPEIEAIQKSLSHRPFDPDSEEHHKFLKNLEKKSALLNSRLRKFQGKKKGSDHTS
jgi:hypothetical protein